MNESMPRILELRPRAQYEASDLDLRPFDMRTLIDRAPIEWMIDVEGTSVVEAEPVFEPSIMEPVVKTKMRRKK